MTINWGLRKRRPAPKLNLWHFIRFHTDWLLKSGNMFRHRESSICQTLTFQYLPKPQNDFESGLDEVFQSSLQLAATPFRYLPADPPHLEDLPMHSTQLSGGTVFRNSVHDVFIDLSGLIASYPVYSRHHQDGSWWWLSISMRSHPETCWLVLGDHKFTISMVEICVQKMVLLFFFPVYGYYSWFLS